MPGIYHRLIELESSRLLHAGGDMRVDIQRSSNLCVAQAFLHDLRLHTLAKQYCRVRMTGIVEPETLQPHDPPYQFTNLIHYVNVAVRHWLPSQKSTERG